MRSNIFFSLGVLSLGVFYHLTAIAQALTEVDVVYPEVEQSAELLTLTGTVEAKQNAELAPLESGVVASLYVEAGDHVEQGQKLLALDNKLAVLNVAQAEAALVAAQVAKAEAERLYQEVITLSKRQLVAETLMGERKAGVATAEAQLLRAQAELDLEREVLARHSLYAPFTGVIAQRSVDLGEWVTQQTKVLNLVSEEQLRVSVAIPQEYFGRLRGKDNIPVTLTPDFGTSDSITSVLTQVVRVASGMSRTLTGYVDLPRDTQLIAGVSVRVDVEMPGSEQQIVWIPKSALKEHPDGGRSIFAVEANKAKRYVVNVVDQKSGFVAITGAPSQLPLVTTGVALLKQDEAVKVNSTSGVRP
ncbi:efflux RND transporter periplasmic adaptor subunit [Thalassotalea euphylliae]|uniref:efflux RND transporter periplasmic adaptor subunit n=1 Tax=Thalassotalea euphylliae TaxID=1655234 RepID=UPI00363F62EF